MTELERLVADDPDAMRSRRDLQRVHRFMGTVSIVAETFGRCEGLRRAGTLRILELGAGDGTLMLRVAKTIGPVAAAVELTLLDRAGLEALASGAAQDEAERAAAAVRPLRRVA